MCPVLRGWRKKLFGDDALALKRGELALAIKEGEVTVLAPEASSQRTRRKSQRTRLSNRLTRIAVVIGAIDHDAAAVDHDVARQAAQARKRTLAKVNAATPSRNSDQLRKRVAHSARLLPRSGDAHA